jgi:hypothetical protein
MGWNIFGAYAVMSFIVYMLYMLLLEVSDYKPGEFIAIFGFQDELYESIKDKLNIYGIIILEALITILTFGASALMFVTGVGICLFMLSWKLFCFVFKGDKYEK